MKIIKKKEIQKMAKNKEMNNEQERGKVKNK